MNKNQSDGELIRRTEDYLKSYTFNRRLAELEKYEREYFEDEMSEWEREAPSDIPLALARMFEIRHFVMDMENSDEKLFLYYRYIKDESVERCAELLNISRSSAYRMRERALRMARERYIAFFGF